MMIRTPVSQIQVQSKPLAPFHSFGTRSPADFSASEASNEDLYIPGISQEQICIFVQKMAYEEKSFRSHKVGVADKLDECSSKHTLKQRSHSGFLNLAAPSFMPDSAGPIKAIVPPAKGRCGAKKSGKVAGAVQGCAVVPAKGDGRAKKSVETAGSFKECSVEFSAEGNGGAKKSNSTAGAGLGCAVGVLAEGDGGAKIADETPI